MLLFDSPGVPNARRQVQCGITAGPFASSGPPPGGNSCRGGKNTDPRRIALEDKADRARADFERWCVRCKRAVPGRFTSP
jgi:hypothetical protein